MAEIGISIATKLAVDVLEKVLKRVSSTVKQEILLVSSLDQNIGFLREILPVIKDLMLNAQALILNQEMSSRYFLLSNSKMFVRGLKEFIYDGEDIVDEFEIQAGRGRLNIKRKWTIARKLKKLYKGFEELKKENQDAENFLKALKDNLQVHQDEVDNSLPLYRNQSTIIIQREDFNVVGRYEDKLWLVHNLLGNRSKPSVLLLTGMGGIGKTTLAHKILHDSKIVNHFTFRKWVTVGDRNLDPKKVLNDMIDRNVDTLIKAIKEVQSCLAGKRFLIVLDDVWTAEDLKHRWNELWHPLSYGGEGSRVIVTTREENVKFSMDGLIVEVKKLDFLSNEECLKIFETYAFPNELNNQSSSPSCPRPPLNLREIGEQIVCTKVKGVPLAARVIGSSLRGKGYMHWKAALNQIRERDINSAILWSYLNLSMHLKQCFVYCSLFPKDTSLKRTEIVQLWMAHSFVVRRDNCEMTLVDIGESYFEDLVNASLLEEKDIFGRLEYKMHDLIHDFALNILGNDFSVCKASMIEKPETLRHLVIAKETQTLPENISDIKKLRTFMSTDPHHLDSLRREQIKTVRSLSLTGHDFGKLSIEASNAFIIKLLKKLQHVRYLNIHGIRASILPESICSMYALQTLILFITFNKEYVQLPKNMLKLINLHHIQAGSGVSSLNRLGQLTKLHSIGGKFFLYSDNWKSLEELRNLKQLRGGLWIGGLDNVQCSELVNNEQLLQNHEHLEELVLDSSGVTTIEVLKYLQPHRNLKDLNIKHYGMNHFPSWLGNKDFNIVSVTLQDGSVRKLPPLGHLPLLKSLDMEQLHGIELIDEEFYGSDGEVIFPSLKKLCLREMYELREWKELAAVSHDQSFIRYFPSLEKLTVAVCPKLRKLPLLPSSLKLLEIDKCDNLQVSQKEFHSSLQVSGLLGNGCEE